MTVLCIHHHIRVESIASDLDLKVNLKHLRHATKKLHKASVKLDHEKHEAEEHLIHIIKRWQRRHHHHHGHAHHDEHHRRHPHPHSHHCTSRWKRLSKWAKGIFGMTSKDAHEVDDSNNYPDNDPQPHEHDVSLPSSYPHHHHPHRPPHKLIKAVKRVQVVNKKLASFESGFISKEGIPEREWYKHLGVAPGKWLG